MKAPKPQGTGNSCRARSGGSRAGPRGLELCRLFQRPLLKWDPQRPGLGGEIWVGADVVDGGEPLTAPRLARPRPCGPTSLCPSRAASRLLNDTREQ